MKIALYLPSWPPGVAASGIVTYASQLVPALRGLGHEVFVLTYRDTSGDTDPHTIDLRRFASKATLWDRAMSVLLPESTIFNAVSSAIASATHELMERHQLDVFEIEESFGFSFAISRLNLLPVVVRLHGPWCLNGRFGGADDRNGFNRRREEREGTGIKCAQFVTAPSAAVLQAVQDHYGLSLTGSQVIPNPLAAADKADIWDIATTASDRLLFVGRFDSLKGGDVVLRTFAELAPVYPRLTLTFVGADNGMRGVGGKSVSFEHFVQSSFPEWLRPRIEFRGKMMHQDVMFLRPKHFATIVASRYEMMPYSVLEAMSLGCPLVATAVGGIPEMIKDRRSGLLVPSDDVQAMSAACRMLLDDHALAARLGRQGWEDCRALYGPETIAKRTLVAYREAIDTFKGRKTA